MYVFRELTDFSYPAIAREFGGRDHTTVIHAVEKVSGLMKERRQVYDQVTALIHRIKSGAMSRGSAVPVETLCRSDVISGDAAAVVHRQSTPARRRLWDPVDDARTTISGADQQQTHDLSTIHSPITATP